VDRRPFSRALPTDQRGIVRRGMRWVASQGAVPIITHPVTRALLSDWRGERVGRIMESGRSLVVQRDQLSRTCPAGRGAGYAERAGPGRAPRYPDTTANGR